jgi:hypothetical protein
MDIYKEREKIINLNTAALTFFLGMISSELWLRGENIEIFIKEKKTKNKE